MDRKTSQLIAITASSEYRTDFQKIIAQEILSGNIILSTNVIPSDHKWESLSEDKQAILSELSDRFIEICDELVVVNPGGYISKKMQADISKATQLGKPIRYAFSEQRVHLTIVEHTCTDKARGIKRTAEEQLYRERRFDRLKEALAEQGITIDVFLESGVGESREPGFCYSFPNGQLTITTVMQFALKNNTMKPSLLQDKIRCCISIFQSLYDPDLPPSWAPLMETHPLDLMKNPSCEGAELSFSSELGRRFAAAIHITNT